MNEDTIAAVSTADAMGAVSMIRISGDEALDIASRLIDKDLSQAKGYTIHYGTVKENGEPVDEVLLNVFRGPHSYNGEDIVEVNCHGGVYITHKVLSLILGLGARMARRGEFTERAFLNGKMDLAQAEGVDELIRADGRLNARNAVHSLKGSVKKLLDPLEEDLTQIISNIEVNIDYPEYDDVHVMTEEEVLPKCRQWTKDIHQIIETAESAMTVRDGIDTAIVGKPNAGKSSLLNALLEEDKAIVTDIAGTTRDVVEGSVRVGDITLHLIDTAGIRHTEDTIERMGIERSRKAIDSADLVIVVLDGSRPLDEDDEELLKATENRTRLVVYNKKDLEAHEEKLSISAKNGEIQPLLDAIQDLYRKNLLAASSDSLNNERQIGLALQAERAMKHAISSLEEGMELDLVTIDLEEAWHALREITGKSGKEDLLDEIFSRFCLGK
jgi:tRNA modification GTPase